MSFAAVHQANASGALCIGKGRRRWWIKQTKSDEGDPRGSHRRTTRGGIVLSDGDPRRRQISKDSETSQEEEAFQNGYSSNEEDTGLPSGPSRRRNSFTSDDWSRQTTTCSDSPIGAEATCSLAQIVALGSGNCGKGSSSDQESVPRVRRRGHSKDRQRTPLTVKVEPRSVTDASTTLAAALEQEEDDAAESVLSPLLSPARYLRRLMRSFSAEETESTSQHAIVAL